MPGDKQHTVAQGESLSKIARQYGLPGYRALLKVNPQFCNGERDPNLIYPGEVIQIPVEDDGATFRVQTDRFHTFTAHRDHVLLQLSLHDQAGHPLPFARFELTAACESSAEITLEGRADRNADIEAMLPHDAERAHLKVWLSDADDDNRDPAHEWELLVHHLDPPDKLTGIQARLKNLGLYDRDVDDDKGERTLDAIHEFKAMHGLPEDDALTADFIQKLQDVHGC